MRVASVLRQQELQQVPVQQERRKQELRIRSRCRSSERRSRCRSKSFSSGCRTACEAGRRTFWCCSKSHSRCRSPCRIRKEQVLHRLVLHIRKLELRSRKLVRSKSFSCT